MPFGRQLRRVYPVRSSTAPAAATSSNLAAQRSREDRELRELLHVRLKIMSLIALLVFASLTTIAYTMSLKNRQFIDPIATLLLVGPTAILWRKRDISIPTLRRFELLLLGIVYASMMANSIRRMNFLAYVPQEPQCLKSMLPAGPFSFIFADGSFYSRISFNNVVNPTILNWSGVISAYGVLIPNTWRRSAVLLSVMVLSAVLCSVYAVYLLPVLHKNAGTLIFFTFFVVAGFAAISLYGSHKISALRTAVLTAKQIGQYSLKKLLGKGGMGEVFLAHHRMLRRPCAVKLIRPEQAGDAGSLARFEREVQAMANLTHPNTVEIYDYGRTEEGIFYYAMEYLPGLSAEEMIRKHGPMPAGRVIHLLRQVCGALGEAHQAGLIHRDIKPANLLICERGRVFDVVKLLDFGLVQLIAGPEPPPPPASDADQRPDPAATAVPSADVKLTQAGHILGTPAYMSPEQASSGSAEPRSDIYSVGAVGYFLLSGQPPFMRASVARMMKAHESEQPAPLAERVDEVDAELSAVIMKCLEKDLVRRYQSVKELEQALGQCKSAASWDADKAAGWWSQVNPTLPADAAESASAQDNTGSLHATLDTRDATPSATPSATLAATTDGRIDASEDAQTDERTDPQRINAQLEEQARAE